MASPGGGHRLAELSVRPACLRQIMTASATRTRFHRPGRQQEGRGGPGSSFHATPIASSPSPTTVARPGLYKCFRRRQAAGARSGPRWIRRSSAARRGSGLGVGQQRPGRRPDVVMACCGDMPTLEPLVAVDLLRRLAPDPKVRIINVVNLMRLQPSSETRMACPDRNFDALFTAERPIIFAFHGYPWLIHRLTYGRAVTEPARPRLEGGRHHQHAVRHVRDEQDRPLPSDEDVIDRVPKLGRGRPTPSRRCTTNSSSIRRTYAAWRRHAGVPAGSGGKNRCPEASARRRPTTPERRGSGVSMYPVEQRHSRPGWQWPDRTPFSTSRG